VRALVASFAAGVALWTLASAAAAAKESACADVLQSVDWLPTDQGSRRSIRLAILEIKLITPLHTVALMAGFRCDAPTRGGACSMSGASWWATRRQARSTGLRDDNRHAPSTFGVRSSVS
jgi:hypothetical protein